MFGLSKARWYELKEVIKNVCLNRHISKECLTCTKQTRAYVTASLAWFNNFCFFSVYWSMLNSMHVCSYLQYRNDLFSNGGLRGEIRAVPFAHEKEMCHSFLYRAYHRQHTNKYRKECRLHLNIKEKNFPSRFLRNCVTVAISIQCTIMAISWHRVQSTKTKSAYMAGNTGVAIFAPHSIWFTSVARLFSYT